MFSAFEFILKSQAFLYFMKKTFIRFLGSTYIYKKNINY